MLKLGMILFDETEEGVRHLIFRTTDIPHLHNLKQLPEMGVVLGTDMLLNNLMTGNAIEKMEDSFSDKIEQFRSESTFLPTSTIPIADGETQYVQ